MTFARTTLIDASPAGDSVKQAILDLDADLTGAFGGLNQLLTSVGGKIAKSEYDQPLGVPRLDSAGKLNSTQLPGTLADGPVGMIAAFGVPTIPGDSNWLACDGAELPMADYPALYAAIGTLFGFASIPANFKLPDLRGYFLRGWNSTGGVDPDADTRLRGNTVGSVQADALGSHVHSMKATKTANVSNAGDNEVQAGIGGYATNDLSTYSAGSSETRPKNIAVLYCIKWR